MRSLLKMASSIAIVSVLCAGHAASGDASTVKTPIGDIPLSFGLPADKDTVARLYDEMDFQRATQAYIWALPIVGFAEWQASTRQALGAGDTDLVIYQSVKDKLGILTANATTPYIGGFPDLSKTGPLVIDYPNGATAGGVGDFWQRPITDMGETGPDKGKGARYLIVGPGQKVPDLKGALVIHSPTNNVFFAFRVLDPDPQKAKALIASVRLYPYADREKPKPTKLITPDGRAWSQVPPRGFAYWERLNDIIQREPVLERDRVMMAMLRPLGFEKGKPFQPDERQKKILTDGAVMGELMAQANSFDTREDGARYRPDANWEYVIMFDPFQEASTYTQIDQRAKYFYEAVTTTKGMVTKIPGVGQAYLAAHADADGHWLDGGKAYTLHVPAGVPAKLFWSVTVYDSLTRVLVDNPQQVADRSSRTDIVKNSDGSVDLYFGPSAPAGHEKNWIPTIPGKAWFAYFRFYGPLQPYFDRSWKLNDIAQTGGR
jgi:hypothetical protein